MIRVIEMAMGIFTKVDIIVWSLDTANGGVGGLGGGWVEPPGRASPAECNDAGLDWDGDGDHDASDCKGGAGGGDAGHGSDVLVHEGKAVHAVRVGGEGQVWPEDEGSIHPPKTLSDL